METQYTPKLHIFEHLVEKYTIAIEQVRKALETWANIDTPDAPDQINGYEDLLQDLIEEKAALEDIVKLFSGKYMITRQLSDGEV